MAAVPMGEIRPELTQAMDEYKRAFIRWAVAAYAYEVDPTNYDVERTRRLATDRGSARLNLDDAHIEFVAALFTWGDDNDDPLPGAEGA